MEQEKQAFFPKLMSILLIAMGIFLGFYAFFANATTWTLPGGTTWDNNNYLTGLFRDNTPTTGDIITALYGTGNEDSIYTRMRSGNVCDPATMVVDYIYPGTDSLPQQLSENTIYVLDSGDYTISYNNGIWMGNCTAIVGSGDVTFYSTDTLNADYAMIYATGTQSNIIDNVKIDGKSNGMGDVHTENGYGIRLTNTANSTINHIEAYNNVYVGAHFSQSNINSVNNSKFYNNYYGILFNVSTNNTVNNIQAFNNTFQGILFSYSTGNSVNNSQSYNNLQYGIVFNQSNNNIINNSQSYNNTGLAGFEYFRSYNNIINNSQSYNNMGGIYTQKNSGDPIIEIIYYGELLLINSEDLISGSPMMTTGLSTDITGSAMGWNDGFMIALTGQESWNSMTNPISLVGTPLLSRGSELTGLMGPQETFTGLTVGYSYGNNIITQRLPVYYYGTTLVAGGTFDATKYIGSDVVKVTGDVSGIPSTSTTPSLTLTIHCPTTASTYIVLGDIVGTKIGSCADTTTGVTLSAGDGEKTILIQFNSTTGSTTTHIARNVQMAMGDTTPPTIATIYIYSGSTGYTIPNYYYKGTVDIKADVSDDVGISGTTCEYTINNGVDRYPASYSGNFCYKTGIIGGADLDINLRVQDTAGNYGTGITRTYIHDGLPPTLLGTGVDYTRATKGGGINDSAIAYSVLVDSGGNSYVAGIFYGTGIFGSTTLVTNGGSDTFIAKLSSTGSYLRATKGGGTNDEETHGVAIDNSGNIYIAGGFQGTANFGSTILISSGFHDTFIAKLSSTGSYLRATKGGGLDDDVSFGLNIDTSGNTYIAGWFTLTGTFGSTTLISSGSQDIFVAKLSSTGAYLRATKGGSTSQDMAKGVSVDASGNSYVAGWFQGTANFGSTTLISSGLRDTFIAKISSTGEYLRAVRGGYTNYDEAVGVATDINGNSYIAGNFQGTTIFGSSTLISSGSQDTFIAKLSSTGTYLRATKGGGTSPDILYGVTIDNNGNSYIAGNFQGTVIFGSSTLISSGGSDTFIAKLSSTGTYLRATKGGGTSSDFASSLTTYNGGDIYLAGSFQGTVSFGSKILVNTGSAENIFITKLSQGTTNLFTINTGTASTNSGNVVLNINCPIDIGIGGVEIAYGNISSPSNRTGCASTKPWSLTAGDGTKTVYMRTRDTLGNITNDYTGTITLIVGQSTSSTRDQETLTGNTPNGSGIDLDSAHIILRTGLGLLNIPQALHITVSGSTWNGNIIAPKLAVGSQQALTGETGLSNIYTIYTTIEAGATGTNLIASNGAFTINILVGSGYSGQYLKIFRSNYNDGNTWVPNTPSTGCTLDSGSYCTFQTDHLSLFTVGSSSLIRDNSNYLTSGFWNAGPTTGNIIQALYGSGTETTAYTQNRSGNVCDPATMIVDYKYPGLDTVPQQLSGNTIYVLNSGDYRMSYTSGIWLSGCSAIIGSGNVIIYSTGTITMPNAMVYASGRQGIIIDAITIDGKSDGLGGIHNYGSPNDYGIKTFSHSDNATINNTKIHNTIVGLSVRQSSHTTINNSQSFNNSDGIQITNSSTYAIINNSKIFNNNNYGLSAVQASNTTINNSQANNNSIHGLYLGSSDHTIINSSQIYNNGENGIYFYASSNNIINNTKAYNNIGEGIKLWNSTSNKYYGTLQLFGNYNNDNLYWLGTTLSGGAGGDYVALSWLDGSINTGGSMDCSWITNPVTIGGIYLQTSGLCTTTGQVVSWTGNTPSNYRYGSNILTQKQPVHRSGGTIALYGTIGSDYDTGRYIGQYGSIGGTFNINNNYGTTIQTGVTIYATITGTPQMRFSNEGSSRSGWQTYNGSAARTLSGNTLGTKTVYADFSGSNDTFMTMDTITYIGIDTTPPTVTTGYIYSGSTGYTTPNYYYKGTIDIRAAVSDTGGISGTTCEYNTGLLSRASANYDGSTYCYKTGLNYTSNITINFRVQDTAGNLSTGTERLYVYDSTAPTFTFSNNSGYECVTGTLNITNAIDTGVGLHATPYSFDGITWDITTGINIPGDQPSMAVSKNGYVRDMFGNSGTTYAVYSFHNVAPTGTNFTGNANVGNSAKNTNWLLSGNAQEGACGNGDITFSGFISQGTKGTCTQAGSTGITYTPNNNQTGTDTCIIQIQDNENTTDNITITWAGIDTTTPDIISPTVATGYIYSGSTGYATPNYYYKGTVDIKADVSDNIGISGATCMYTTGTSRASALYSGTTTTGYCYVTGIVGGASLNISFKVQDTSSNISTGTEKTYVYDGTAPTFTFSGTSTTEATPLILSVSGASDVGIGLATSGYNFSIDGITRNGRQANSGFSFGTQNEPTSTGLRAKVRDTLGNESSAVLATGTWTNVAPTANNLTGSAIESTAILFTATGTDPGNTTFTYKRYTGAACGGSVLSTSQTFTGSNNEPGILVRSYQLIDAQLLSGCAVVTGTWTNVAPLATFTYNTNQIITTPIIWTGIGMDTGATFSYQWYYDAACSTVVAGQTGVSTSVTLAVAGTTGRYVKISDSQGSGSNCTGGIGTWYTSDTTPPLVSTGYIYSGSTGNNGVTLYYKGTVDIKADVSDNIQISGASCLYTTGGAWASASYYGTTVAGYCYKTGIVGSAPLNIAFRIQDTTGNLTTGATEIYLYDATSPTFTFANATGYECTTGTLSITGANDTGAGLHATPYGFDGITWGTITGITIPAQGTTGIITKTGYVRDILTNTLSIAATYTFLNTGVTANNFTGHTNVGYIPKTVNRKTGSNTAEGSCGSGDIIYSGIVTQGTKGACTVVGNNITYTPAAEQSGSDTCMIQIKDNENSTGNITVLWTGINSVGIIADYSFTGMTQTGLLIISGGYYGTGIRITFTGLTISGATLDGIPYTSGSLITGDATHIFILQDTLGHSTGTTFTIDMTPPTFTGTTLSSLSVISGGYYTTGITITFSDLHLSGATLNGSGYTGGTLITGDRSYVFLVKDTLGNSTGMTFTIDTTNPSVTGTAPASGASINTTSNVVFTWTGLDANMSGYAIYITGAQIQTLTTTGTSITGILENGTYTRYVIATDYAGNTGISISTPFTVIAPFLPVMSMLTGNIQSNTTGSYTKDTVSLYLRTNKTANYSFTGNFTTPTPPFLVTGFSGGVINIFTLTTGDGQKNIYLNVTDGLTTTGKIFTLYLDTTAPSIPTLISPISGAAANGVFPISWSAASDTGIGFSGYQYFVSTTGTIGTGIVTSGYTTSTSKSFTNGEIGTSGTFYRYVKSIDRLGNSGTSASQPFSYTGTLDTTPDQFTLGTRTNALINRIYSSDLINSIAGLSNNTSVLAYIDKGALFINGFLVSGHTGYVTNGSEVQIELTSSSNYHTPVTSTLTIGGVTSTFLITTETDPGTTPTTSTSLSATAKLQIVAIFEALRDVYAGVKQDEFLNSFMVMLQSKMDDLGTSTANKNTRYALQYMYDLVDNYRGNIGTDVTTIPDIVNGIYTAPNGKKYTITYDSTMKQFTSPNFLTPKYFATRDSFKYVIDINNPAGSSYLNAKAIKARRGKIRIDGTWQTAPYTAPNHKVFYFFKTMEGQYSSYTFTVEKYFDGLDAVKEFIHNSNLK